MSLLLPHIIENSPSFIDLRKYTSGYFEITPEVSSANMINFFRIAIKWNVLICFVDSFVFLKMLNLMDGTKTK